VTVGRFFEDWLAARRSRLRPGSLARRGYLLGVVAGELGAVRLARLRPHHLQALIGALQAGHRGRRPWGPSTRRLLLGVTKAALTTAVRWRLIPENPAHYVEAPAAGRTERPARTPGQVRAGRGAADAAARAVREALRGGLRGTPGAVGPPPGRGRGRRGGPSRPVHPRPPARSLRGVETSKAEQRDRREAGRPGGPDALDYCPVCWRSGEPMTRVLEVGGGPDEPGGGRFLLCLVCQQLHVRAQGRRQEVASQHARVLAREVLRLKLRLASLLAPELDDASAGPPPLVTRIRTDPGDGRLPGR
jgi:hypothetical protein